MICTPIHQRLRSMLPEAERTEDDFAVDTPVRILGIVSQYGGEFFTVTGELHIFGRDGFFVEPVNCIVRPNGMGSHQVHESTEIVDSYILAGESRDAAHSVREYEVVPLRPKAAPVPLEAFELELLD